MDKKNINRSEWFLLFNWCAIWIFFVVQFVQTNEMSPMFGPVTLGAGFQGVDIFSKLKK